MKSKNKPSISYETAIRIFDQFPETPAKRNDCINLLQLAGYHNGLNGKPYDKIGDQQLFAAAQSTRRRAEELLNESERIDLVKELERDYLNQLYVSFGFSPDADDAPDPEELERRLLD